MAYEERDLGLARLKRGWRLRRFIITTLRRFLQGGRSKAEGEGGRYSICVLWGEEDVAQCIQDEKEKKKTETRRGVSF